MINRVTRCRICENSSLHPVVDLGEQYLTGVFPHTITPALTRGPLRLVKCDGGDDVCGLLQLEHSYDLGEMYGDNYGYRSGLNPSMVRHLHDLVRYVRGFVSLDAGDLVIDIGSNDGTTLGAYPTDLRLVGVDPTGSKFRQYYAPHIELIPDFFSARLVRQAHPDRLAKVVTSFSMFYDLEHPVEFAREVASVLDPNDGIWVFEQSYMPLMLERVAYDTICHEHLEYYGLRQIQWIADRAGLKLVDVQLNDTNGGSFCVTATPKSSRHADRTGAVARLLAAEAAGGLSTLAPYQAFAQRTAESREALRAFVQRAVREGKQVCGLGASTKGNVVLQYCGFTPDDIPVIGDVNPDKFGAFAPGTWIPIANEATVLAADPAYLLVLPWHFRDFFVQSPTFAGRSLVFPLPTIEVVPMPATAASAR